MVAARNQYPLFYQKPSSPVTRLAKTRKIQVMQSTECNHDQYGVSDTETPTPKHGGSHVPISSNRDITATASTSNMEKPLGNNNYKLIFRNKIRVVETPDKVDNQRDLELKSPLMHSNNTGVSNSCKSNENAATGKFNSSIPIPKFSNKLTKKPPIGSDENHSPYNSRSLSKFNRFGFAGDIGRAFNLKSDSYTSASNGQEMRDSSFQGKFKREDKGLHLNEFSNTDEMYRVSSKYSPAYNNLTQITTSVAVEFFAR